MTSIFFKYLKISLHPVAYENEMNHLQVIIQKKDKQIAVLKKELQLEKLPEIDAFKYNSLISMDDFFSNETNVNKYHAQLQASVYKLFLQVLTDNVAVAKSDKILDAACGLGVFTRLMRDKLETTNVSGFDFSNTVIVKAREENEGLHFFCHDIYNPLDEQYDLICCLESLEHLANPEAAIQNLIASLTDKGILYLTVPDGRIDQSSRHINFWSPESWAIFVNKVNHNKYQINIGVAQHPEVKTLRYNWAIIKHM
jgi:2-polyprenyl-3-methyl-5-hydroxy-6-metoxy-1,4-benzoquinol methylase